VPVYLQEQNSFHFEPEELKQKISSDTKMIIICSPNNPTGTVFSKDELRLIADLSKEYNLLVLSDEIYDQFVYDGNEHHSIAAISDMMERTMVIMSFSKTFAMTGWRLGTLLAEKTLMASLRRIPVGGRPATFIQMAGVAALKGSRGPVEQFRCEYQRRRNAVVKMLNQVEGFSCQKPEGAFYLFPTFKDLGKTSLEFCEGLLDEQKVAIVPGTEFGKAGEYHMRLPLVNSLQYLETCVKGIESYVQQL
jgi:aspartate/methionine/tyrosine aminotransferase